jgi:outer membrane protein
VIRLALLLALLAAAGITHADPVTAMQEPAGAIPERLSLADAQAIALQTHPRIASQGFRAQASGETVKETEAELYPQIYGSANRVFGGANTRVTAPPSGITDPSIFARAAAGVSVSQLITDFGRQSDLIAASKLALKSEQDQVQSVRDSVFFKATQAYYDVLRAQALLDVARQTIKSRSTLNEQVTQLRSAKLKSDLDASFAKLGLDQAHLLESKAQGNLDDAWAELAEALGLPAVRHFILTDLHGRVAPPSESRDEAISLALSRNPELMARDAAREAAHRQADADAEAGLPVISAQGFAGVNPMREPDQRLSHSYGAAGIFVTIPIFTGGRLTAEERRSAYNAKAADRDLDAERNQLSRDVQMAWNSAQTAYRNIAVTSQLLESSGKALDLTHARYDIGSSSIVEVEQAEVAALEARIAQSNATYDYLIERAFLAYREGAAIDAER